MGKKGTKKRTKWQALAMDDGDENSSTLGSRRPHHYHHQPHHHNQQQDQLKDFTLGDNRFKTVSMGAPKSSYHSSMTTGPDGAGAHDEYEAKRDIGFGRSFLTEKDQNSQSDTSSTVRSYSANGQYYGQRDNYYNQRAGTYRTGGSGGGGGGGPRSRNSQQHSINSNYHHHHQYYSNNNHINSSSSSKSVGGGCSSSTTSSTSSYHANPAHNDRRWRSNYGHSHSSYSQRHNNSNSNSYYQHQHYHNQQHPYHPTQNSTATTTSSNYNNNNNTNNYSNKENATSITKSVDDEYTRITTPRQDVLFKKGYLSRPRRNQYVDETGSGAIFEATAITESADRDTVPNADPLDPNSAQSQDLYVYHGYVDENGLFYVNPYMPNSFDPYGQPLVMMPYPTTAPSAANGFTTTEEVANATETNSEPSILVANDGHQPESSELESKILATAIVPEGVDQISAVEGLQQLEVERDGEEVKLEDVKMVIEMPVVEPVLEVKAEEEQTKAEDAGKEVVVKFQSEPMDVTDCGDKNGNSVSVSNPNDPDNEGIVKVSVGGGVLSVDDIPEFVPQSQQPVDVDAVNTLPLDPASTNFYPQSPVYHHPHPYYPLVFTPQTLPPNTSIIPLADLYYNESYASLAAELHGLTDSTGPSYSSTSCDEDQMHMFEDQPEAAQQPPDQQQAGDEQQKLAREDCDGTNEGDELNNCDAGCDKVTAAPMFGEDHKLDNVQQLSLAATISPAEGGPIVIDNAAELVQKSKLNVDVAEFHPQTVSNNYPTMAEAMMMKSHVNQRDAKDDTKPKPQHPNSNNNNSYSKALHPSRKPAIESNPERERQQPINKRVPKRSPNKQEQSNRVVGAAAATAASTTSATLPSQPPPKPISIPGKSSKTNTKRSIIASTKHFEKQNIDLKKTSIGAVVQNADSALNANQWLVKTKGKKGRIVVPIDILDDMIEEPELPPTIESVPVTNSDVPAVVEEDDCVAPLPESVATSTATTVTAAPTTTSGKAKKKANGPQKAANPKSVPNKAKGKKVKAKSNPSGGFEVIEPDFGVITKLKTDPIVAEPYEYDDLLRDIDLEVTAISEESVQEVGENKAVAADRSFNDNIIDLDNLEALERSLMDFDMTGELQERMIEIIKSGLEVPTTNDVEDEEEKQVKKVDTKVLTENQKDVQSGIEGEEGGEVLDIVVVEDDEMKTVDAEVAVLIVDDNVNAVNESQDDVIIIEDDDQVMTSESSREDNRNEEVIEIIDQVQSEESRNKEDEEETQQELNIITRGIEVDNHSSEGSSVSSSLSSPIPTDDGRDGSNSESDDNLTPIQEVPIEKLPLKVDHREERIVTTGGVGVGNVNAADIVSVPVAEAKGIITDTITKWLNEKERENQTDSVFKLPKDPQKAKLIYKMVYGIDYVEPLETDEDDYDVDDDGHSLSASELSADESDFESDDMAESKNLSNPRVPYANNNANIKNNRSDNKSVNGNVLVDTDSDYMSDGQNIVKVDGPKGTVAVADDRTVLVRNGKSNGVAAGAGVGRAGKLKEVVGEQRRGQKMCKVM